MRKLKLQMQQTVNGFVGGPNGEMDWMDMNWGDDINQYVTALTDPVDTIIMGRKLAEGFIPYWADAASKAGSPDFAHKMNDTAKVVFSKTLVTSNWERTTLAKGNLKDEINNLKNKSGGDIIVYGGANFVSNLIHEGLIDEFHLSVNPSAISTGLSIFNERINLKLINATAFTSGKVVLHYEPIRK
jgi:dihydrofolate reductase